MKRFKWILILCCTSHLFADNLNWYVEDTNSNIIQNEQHRNQENTLGFKYVGGINQDEIISWEASYINFGLSDDIEQQFNQSTQSYALGGKFNIFKDNELETNLKFGVHRWEQNIQEIENIGTDIYYGLGINIPIGKNIYVTTDYESYQLGSKIDNYAIGFTYRF